MLVRAEMWSGSVAPTRRSPQTRQPGVDVEELLVDAGEVRQVEEPVPAGEDEDATATCAPGAGYGTELSGVELVAAKTLEVGFQARELQPRVGDPLVEALHELSLRDGREARGAAGRLVDARIQPAVEGGVRDRVAEECCKTLLLEVPELSLVKPRGLSQFAPAHPDGSEEVHEPLDRPSTAHRRLLRKRNR